MGVVSDRAIADEGLGNGARCLVSLRLGGLGFGSSLLGLYCRQLAFGRATASVAAGAVAFFLTSALSRLLPTRATAFACPGTGSLKCC